MKDVEAKILIDAFHNHVDNFVTGEVFHKGTIIGAMKKACGSDARYRQVLKVLTGRTTSKLLNDAQWYALYKFTLPYKPEGGVWQSKHGDDVLYAWCNTLVRFDDANEKQMVMP